MLLSSLSFAYEYCGMVAVTTLHTAGQRESSVRVRVQKRVMGWVLRGRYGAWVDYICMCINHGGMSARCACYSTVWWVGG